MQDNSENSPAQSGGDSSPALNQHSPSVTLARVDRDGDHVHTVAVADDLANAINLDSLRSALRVLDPDCTDNIWAGKRVAPLARAAKQHPAMSDQLWQLAVEWSSGKLRGKRSTTWSNDGAHGKRRRVRLHFLWQHYQSPKAGKHPNPATIRSIYFHAFQEGWTGESFK